MTRAGEFSLERARVAYNGHAALGGIDLRVRPGEAVAVVGPSGAGKTTLLRLLNGTVRPSEGSVAVDDRRLDRVGHGELREIRARIGFVHQDFSLVPNLRVHQNVALGRVGRRGFWGSLASLVRPSRDELRRVHAILERVGIPEKLFERTDTLSGGQQQRVAIARALYQEPEALLADEPVSSVDPARARDTVALLASISREEGLTLCVSLHNLDLAREFFPRLVGLRAGRVVFDRPASELDDDAFRTLYVLGREEMLEDA